MSTENQIMCEQRAKITIENNNKYMTNENICISRSNHLQWMSDVLLMSNAPWTNSPCSFSWIHSSSLWNFLQTPSNSNSINNEGYGKCLGFFIFRWQKLVTFFLKTSFDSNLFVFPSTSYYYSSSSNTVCYRSLGCRHRSCHCTVLRISLLWRIRTRIWRILCSHCLFIRIWRTLWWIPCILWCLLWWILQEVEWEIQHHHLHSMSLWSSPTSNSICHEPHITFHLNARLIQWQRSHPLCSSNNSIGHLTLSSFSPLSLLLTLCSLNLSHDSKFTLSYVFPFGPTDTSKFILSQTPSSSVTRWDWGECSSFPGEDSVLLILSHFDPNEIHWHGRHSWVLELLLTFKRINPLLFLYHIWVLLPPC